MRRPGRDRSAPLARIGDDVLDLRLAMCAVISVNLVSPIRNELSLIRTSWNLLVPPLWYCTLARKPVTFETVNLNVLLSGYFPVQVPSIELGIDRHVGRLGRNGQSHRLVVGRYDAHQTVSHLRTLARTASAAA